MTLARVADMAWWEHDAPLRRVVCDLINGELTALRRRAVAKPLPWDGTLHLVRDLEVVSLELLAFATALSETLHIHRSGIDDYLLTKVEIDDWAAIAQKSLREFSAEITFRTSGGSGSPKRCPHLPSTLWKKVAELATLFQGRRRILGAVPSHHIYGFLFTVLLPQTLQHDPVPVLDLRGSTPGSLAHALRDGDLVVAPLSG